MTLKSQGDDVIAQLTHAFELALDRAMRAHASGDDRKVIIGILKGAQDLIDAVAVEMRTRQKHDVSEDLEALATLEARLEAAEQTLGVSR